MRRERCVVLATALLVMAGCGGGSSKITTAPPPAAHPASLAAARPPCPSASATHRESTITYAQLPAVTKAQVDKVRAVWAHKYPTAAAAVKAGWWKSTPNLYGIGAHYIKGFSGLSVAVPFDMLHPNILLYDGEGPDAKFAGVSYVVSGNIAGFAGCYDYWHSHPSVCIDNQNRITLTEPNSKLWYSERECRLYGFHVLRIPADKMLHVWIGPGYTNAPIFAHDNPKLYDGYYPKRST